MKFAGWVDKTVQAYYEMIYQIDYEYLFDSSKFAKHDANRAPWNFLNS